MPLRIGVRRRWLRISLRTFLLLVVVLCAWLAYITNRARKQEELVRRMIYEGGGVVVYQHQFDDARNPIHDAEPPGPAWLRRLLGEHVFLRLHTVMTYHATDEDLRLISQFDSIEWLGLDGRVRDEGMRHVAALRNLKELDLDSPYQTDRSLEYIRNLHQLEILKVSGSRISDEGLKCLAGLPKLNFVLLEETQVTAAGIDWLRKRFPKLTVVPSAFPSAPEEHDGVQQLVENGARFSADNDGYVESVTFYGPEATDEALLPLESLSRLKRLAATETRITLAGVDRLRQIYPNLKVSPEFRQPIAGEAEAIAVLRAARFHVRFDKQGYVTAVDKFNEGVTDEMLAPLAALHRLKSVGLFVPTINVDVCNRLGDVKSLESLNTWEANFRDVHLKELSDLPNLKRLQIGGPEITDAGLEALSKLPALEELYISRATIVGPGLAHLKRVKRLHVGFLPPDGLTDEGLAYLSGLTNLRSLGVTFARITDDGLRHLEKLSELEEFSISGSDVTDLGLRHLCKLVNLKELSLEGREITDEGLLNLANSLPKLKQLFLKNTQVTASGVREFKTLLPQSRVLH